VASSRTGLLTISWLIISFSSRRFSCNTVTICTRPGVRICFCATLSCSLGESKLIAALMITKAVPQAVRFKLISACSESLIFQLVSVREGCGFAQGKGLAQIDAFDLRIPAQRLRAASAEDAAVIDDVRAVGDHQRLAHVMVGNQDANAGALQIEDDALQ